MKYSLGPVLYYWPKETLEDFYQQAASCSADTIYLGEAVCSKRRATKVGDWIDMAKTLAGSGKQVVLSTLALVQASSELGELKRYVDNGEFLIEASDLGVVNLCAERKLPFVAGHALNCYNAVTLRLLLKQGMVRWCMPVELSRDWLANLLQPLAYFHSYLIFLLIRFETEKFASDAFYLLPITFAAFVRPDYSFNTEISKIAKHSFGKKLGCHSSRSFIVACQIGVSDAPVMIVL